MSVQRNPGPAFKLASCFRISRSLSSAGHFGAGPVGSIRATKEREAERRQTRISNLRTHNLHPPPLAGRTEEGRGARPAGRARLSAFHRGSCLGDPTPPLSSGYALPGTEASTGVTRLEPVPVQRAPRRPVIVPAGRIPGAARDLRSQANLDSLSLYIIYMMGSCE